MATRLLWTAMAARLLWTAMAAWALLAARALLATWPLWTVPRTTSRGRLRSPSGGPDREGRGFRAACGDLLRGGGRGFRAVRRRRWACGLGLLPVLVLLAGCGGDGGAGQVGGSGAGARDGQLIEAARRGDAGEVRRLLERGAGVTARDPEGATALVAAAYGNHVEAARAVVNAGADVNAKDRTEQSAFLLATSENYLELLELTLGAGADVAAKDSYNGTGLIRAAERGHAEVVRRLLATPIEVDHVNRLGWTALLEAIILGEGGPGHTRTVRLLVDAGADVNLGDQAGVTPLAHAEQRGQDQIAAILRAAGARR